MRGMAGRKSFNHQDGTFFDVASFPCLNRTDPSTFAPGMAARALCGRARDF
jgi:hypothetical protein